MKHYRQYSENIQNIHVVLMKLTGTSFLKLGVGLVMVVVLATVVVVVVVVTRVLVCPGWGTFGAPGC